MIEYVDDVAAAREARGVRMVVSGILPSPWSEAAKGVFHLARVPVLAVRWIRGEPETIEWTGVRNVPSVVHDDEPPRTAAAEIVSLADRLAQGALLSAEAEARVRYGEVDVYTSEFRPLKHTLSGSAERAFMKLVVCTADQRVLGVHLCGADSPEIIQGFAVALTCGATKAQLDATVGLHPTAAEELVTMREKRP